MRRPPLKRRVLRPSLWPSFHVGRVALPLTVAAAVLLSLGVGGWKVRDVRRENHRLALEAQTCRTEQAAFLSVLEAVARSRPAAGLARPAAGLARSAAGSARPLAGPGRIRVTAPVR